MEQGIFSEQTLSKITAFRPILLRVTVWTFIGGVVLSALLILVGGSGSSEVIWKVLGTLFILALMMLISVNNFRRIESRQTAVQIFATGALVMNLLWALMWILALWGVFDVWSYEVDSCVPRCVDASVHPKIVAGFSLMGKITFVVTILSALGFFASNIMAIKEYNRRKIIFPLKVTAVVCLAYEELFGMMLVVGDLYTDVWHTSAYDDGSGLLTRMSALSAFASVIWFVTTLVALVLSSSAKKHRPASGSTSGQPAAAVITPAAPNLSAEATPSTVPSPMASEPVSASAPPVASTAVAPATVPVSAAAPPVIKTDEQLRAEIEQKVRAEMIEKEVRARLAAEQEARLAAEQGQQNRLTAKQGQQTQQSQQADVRPADVTNVNNAKPTRPILSVPPQKPDVH